MRSSTGFKTLLFALVLSSFPLMAAAQTNDWIKEENRFINLIDGTITGMGASTAVTGNWNWQDNYFCRNLSWEIGTWGLIAKKLS